MRHATSMERCSICGKFKDRVEYLRVSQYDTVSVDSPACEVGVAHLCPTCDLGERMDDLTLISDMFSDLV